MSVKTIFKTIIGTILTIAISFVVIELFNVEIQSIQLNKMINLSGSQAAALFAQETYKTDTGTAGSVNMDSVKDHAGGEYITGKFYSGTSEASIYNSLYRTSSFSSWAASHRGTWLSVDCIASGLGHGSGGLGPLEVQTGQMYVKNYVTPLNMGVPYMDEKVLEKMFRWNLAQTLSACNSDLIMEDAYGQTCVYFNGFRIYADEAKISVEYEVFDIGDWAGASDFYDLTSINPSGLNGSISTSLGTYTENPENMNSELGYGDERRYVCIIGIKYEVPISYEGVTPMRQLFSYVWHNDASNVTGLDGAKSTRETLNWNTSKVTFKGGGFEGSDSGAVPNKLIYYIVR